MHVGSWADVGADLAQAKPLRLFVAKPGRADAGEGQQEQPEESFSFVFHRSVLLGKRRGEGSGYPATV